MAFKKELLEQVNANLVELARELKTEISSVQEEMSLETKSSAGDKFETSREMMSQEKSRLEERLDSVYSKKRNVSEMMETAAPSFISQGALVGTENNLFLFGIALGKIDFKGKTIMAVSLNSPIGLAFRGKKLNEQVSFMNKQYTIKTIS